MFTELDFSMVYSLLKVKIMYRLAARLQLSSCYLNTIY
nr:MAG TPA: hypothetical protein [Caudoviricetes sp.]